MILNKNFTEPCTDCPKEWGIEVFYDTTIRKYTYAPGIYGHYQLQDEEVNKRVYFKKGNDFAIWWNGDDKWIIGLDSSRGLRWGFGNFQRSLELF